MIIDSLLNRGMELFLEHLEAQGDLKDGPRWL